MQTLYLVSPELHGPAVATAQARLRAHHYDPGPQDGVYGPVTERAVTRFQGRVGLAVDGVVGDKTWLALEHTGEHAPPAPGPPNHHRGHGHPLGDAAVKWVIERQGMTEHPPGSNVNAITEEFGLPGQPWCAMTVSLGFKHGAGVVLGAETHPAPVGYWSGRGFAYCPYLEAWGKIAGYWIGRSSPQRGDVALYILKASSSRPQATQPNHTGLVVAGLDGAGTFAAVEGNEGDTITMTRRPMSDVAGFLRVRG